MKRSYSIACGTVLKRVSQGSVERADRTVLHIIALQVVQHEVDGSSSRTFIPPRPLFQRITPETPKLRSVRGDLEPMVTNEEEIVSALQQCTKGEEVFVQDDVPTKDGPENFGGYDCGYVQ